MHARTRPTLYEQLEVLPEETTGEILDGQIYTQARPSLEHSYTETSLAEELVGPFQKGRSGGPGGSLIVVEPELHFIRDSEVDVPDLAGWRRKRLPRPPPGHRATVVPNRVCEILSHSTEGKDRQIKMPIYAQYGVTHAWLIDPQAKTLEACTLESGAQWREIGRFAGHDPVSVAPFDAVVIHLEDLRAPT